jgi:DNA-binding NarL/FixJ family response regulator
MESIMTNNQSSLSSNTPPLRRVAFVSRFSEQLILDTVLTTFEHDVVFVEPVAQAYSNIKRAAPDLVVMCLSSDDIDACRVLSMLALDSETARIPVLTVLTPDCCDAMDADTAVMPDQEAFCHYGSIPLH